MREDITIVRRQANILDYGVYQKAWIHLSVGPTDDPLVGPGLSKLLRPTLGWRRTAASTTSGTRAVPFDRLAAWSMIEGRRVIPICFAVLINSYSVD